MRDPFLLAELYRLRNQGVHWPFVIMLIHRDYVKERGYAVNVDHFQEAYKLFIPVGSDKYTSIEIRREFSFDRLHIFPKMPETLPLPNRDFIINSMDASYEAIIKWHNADCHSALGAASDILP